MYAQIEQDSSKKELLERKTKTYIVRESEYSERTVAFSLKDKNKRNKPKILKRKISYLNLFRGLRNSQRKRSNKDLINLHFMIKCKLAKTFKTYN